MMHNINLNIWALRIAKLIKKILHSIMNSNKYFIFYNYFKYMKNNETLNSKQLKNFKFAYYKFFNDIIFRVNIMITMLSNIENFNFWKHFLFDVIILNKTFWALKFDIWNILNNYNIILFFIIDDDFQFQSMIMSN